MKTFVLLNLVMASLMIFVTVATFCDPVALWTLDEGSGDKIVDHSGNGNDGVITGIVGGAWGEGKFNGALYFDGGKKGVDYITVEHSKSLDITDAITIMAWFQPETLGGDGLMSYRFLVKKEAVYALDIIGYNVCLYLANPSEKWTTPASGKTKLKENQWYHLAGTYDGKTMRVYVDGEMDGETAWGEKIGTTDRVIMMGMNVQNNVPMRNISSLIGTMDEVAIYNEALSPTEIKKIMKGGIASIGLKGKIAITWAQIK
jgi:hypothetical protein